MSAGIKANNDGSAAIQVGGVDRVTLTNTGNVGIGTTAPSSDAIGTFVNVSNAISSGLVMTAARKYSIYSSSSSTLEFRDETAADSRASITSTGLFQFNSGYGSVATAYGCRAWVNFNGTGTVAIRASGNVSSITDNGTGNYTVSLTNAMPDASYSAVASSNLDQEIRVDTYVAGYFRIVTDSTVTDASIVSAAIFR